VLDVRAAARTSPAYQVAVTVCERCKGGHQDGAGVVVEMSAAAVERALCDAQRIGSIDPGTSPPRATQTVPPATRRKVLRRDHGTCRAPACRSTRNIDIHHVIPRAAGGKHTSDNLVTLCEGHHLALHEGALVITGDASNFEFTRRASSAFEQAGFAADAGRALRTLGFGAGEVAAAMKQARAHVGSTEHTQAQWIAIALRYCPRPVT
jgi:hypothetical protein